MVVTRLTLFNCCIGEPSRPLSSEWEAAKKDTWTDKHKIPLVEDQLEKKIIENDKIAFQAGKGNNHIVSTLIPPPPPKKKQMSVLADQEVRLMAGFSNTNRFVFLYTSSSEEHVLGNLSIEKVSKLDRVKDPHLTTAIKIRHNISTMYALLDLPKCEQKLIYWQIKVIYSDIFMFNIAGIRL